jgi:glycosyltransferase involved in cell wall biosynthesis
VNISIDISPLKTGHFLQHRVRGTGQYLEKLKLSLEKYFPRNKYSYFIRGEKISKDADVIHYPYFEPFFLTLPLKSLNKSIVTVHDLTPLVFPKNFPSGIKGNLRWIIQKRGLKKLAAIITDSQSSKKDIVKHAGVKEEKIHVVYLAAGEEFKVLENKAVLGKTRSKYNLPDKFVLYVGDVTWNKNLPRLLEAVIAADLPLVIVGKAIKEDDFDRNNSWNQDRVKVRDLISKNESILALGFVPAEELPVIYNLATVFAMPSIYEGFGLPILEAMSCGCPVVTSKSGSIPEIAGNAAFYVDPYSVLDIASGIRKIFENAALAGKLSKEGIEQAGRFAWKKTAEDTVAVYEKTTQGI